jgi:hypothetical protein
MDRVFEAGLDRVLKLHLVNHGPASVQRHKRNEQRKNSEKPAAEWGIRPEAGEEHRLE